MTKRSNKLNQYTAIASSWNGGASSSYREYSYDDADRLIAVVSKNLGAGANETKTKFAYDGLSRLQVPDSIFLFLRLFREHI